MYYGGKNQEPNLQWSSKIGREKQEKCDKAILQSRRVCKKKDLISSIPFTLNTTHQTMWHKSPKIYIVMLPKFTLPRLKQLNYLKRHNPLKSKQTQHHGPHLKSYRAMKKKMIHQLPTPLTHVTKIKNNNTPFCEGYQL